MQTENHRRVPSREGIRLTLKQRTGAQQVDTAVIDRVVEMLHEELERIVAHATRAYEAEKDVRRFHRRPSPLLAPHHLPQGPEPAKPRPPDPDV